MKNELYTCIITINDDSNYGNRLQNYALQEILNIKDKTTTIYIRLNENNYLIYFIRFILHFFRHLLSFFKIPSKRNENIIIKRIQRGREFTDSFVRDDLFSVSSFSHGRSIARWSICRYVIGSDQVWNYQWLSKEDLALRLGSFVPDKVPIISYAASFGVSELSDDVKPIFQKYLPRLRAISVREDRGAELVKEMTGLDATVVLDPTLMLSTEQWNRITRGFVPDNDRYVLMYFLGKPSDAQERTIQEYARKHGCRVRRILDLRDKETYVAGPQDFVELFSKAQYVFTDSYHACCFSILYHKQFTVFNRAGMEGKANMNSRMETLFRLFDLDSVVMDKGLAPQIDYEKVDRLLAQHREESQTWLDKAISEE